MSTATSGIVDLVYTDLWVSMGELDADWATRVPLLMPYRVTAELMAAAGRGDTKFLANQHGWSVAADREHWRRLVASPQPQRGR